MSTEQRGQSLPSPGSQVHALLTPLQASLSLVSAWVCGWPWFSSLPAGAQDHPPQLLPGSISPSLRSCSTPSSSVDLGLLLAEFHRVPWDTSSPVRHHLNGGPALKPLSIDWSLLVSPANLMHQPSVTSSRSLAEFLNMTKSQD